MLSKPLKILSNYSIGASFFVYINLITVSASINAKIK